MGNTKRGLTLGLVCLACACGDYDTGSQSARAGGLEGFANGEAREQLPVPGECDAVLGWDPGWIALEEEMLRLINEARANGASCAGPTHPLELHTALQCAARLHAMDMDERAFYQHVNPDGDGPRERMEALGYDLGPWGENIFKGPTTAQEAMDGFMESPSHCMNIMSPEITIVGIGVHGTTWTQNFSN